MSKQNGDRDPLPRVERDENGDLMVRADGRLYPAVEQHVNEDGVTGVSRCPHGCRFETHTHGVADELISHRVSHCPLPKDEDDRGYFLLRPHISLFDKPIRWWEESRDEVRRGLNTLSMVTNLGFGDPDAPALEGPGLLDVEGI